VDVVDLLERERDTERIEELLRRARAGAGGVALIVGGPGIGKSQLAGHTARRARELGLVTHSASGSELEQDYALGVVRQLLERALRRLGPEQLAELLRGAGAAGGAALGLAPWAEPDTADAGFAVMHGLYWLVADLASSQPMALIVDDAHWGDRLSVRFLSFLARRIHELPAVLVLAVRAAEAAADDTLAELELAPGVHVVRPAPLTADGCAALIERALGVAPESEFATACHAATSGNPLLMHGLAHALAADAVAPTASAVARIGALGPPAVTGFVKRALRTLSEPTVRFARAAAVLGPAAERRHAASLADLTDREAMLAHNELVAADVLASEQRLNFVHPLVAEAVYQLIPLAEQALGHARAARDLSIENAPAEAIAAQLLRCDPLGEPWVVDRLQHAASDAHARGVPEVAVRYLRRALQEPRAAGDETLLLALGIAEARAADPAAVDRLREVFERSDDQDAWLRAAFACGLASSMQGRHTDLVAIYDRARERVSETDPKLAGFLDAAVLLGAQLDRSTAHVARDRAPAVRAAAEEDPDAPAHACAALAQWAGVVGDPANEVARWTERALRQTPTGPIPPGYLGYVGYALILTEQYARAVSVADESIHARARVGDLPNVAASSTVRAWAHYRSGEIAAAEADARIGTDAARVLPGGIYARLSAAILADALIERGELAEADRVSADAAQPGEADGSLHHAFLVHVRGRVLAAQGQYENALVALIDARQRFEESGWIGPAVACWRSDMALVLHALGEQEQARALAATEVTLARAFGRPGALGIALRGQGLVEGGAHGLALLGDAVSVLETSAARLQHAAALIALGGALRRDNQRARARTPLAEGARIATRCGAHALVEHAHQELLASGARPRRFGVELRDALTPSEHRIAELAAQGLSNRDIAQTLFVTLRTVETHLTHAYRKLEITTRHQLPTALKQHGK
jgi:DNA-binding CsgD family transcriptional regulator